MTTANKITLIRVGMIPFFIYFAYQGTQTCDIIALCIFLLASMTDALDGYIARHYNQTSDFGKFLDPLADKLLVTAAMLIFVQWGRMPAWAVMIVLTREFIITSLRIVAIGKGRVLAAAWSGKVKTTLQIVGTAAIFLTDILGWPMVVQTVSGWAMTLITLYSGFDYMKRNWDIVADGATSKK